MGYQVRTKRLLQLSTLACVLAVASSAAGQECTTEQRATPGSPCVPMSRAGQPGIWFQLQLANDLTLSYAQAPEIAAQLARYTELARVEELSSTYWRETAADREKQAVEAGKLAEIAAKSAQAYADKLASEQASAASVWRSPVLWFVVGGAVGAGAVTALALAVR